MTALNTPASRKSARDKDAARRWALTLTVALLLMLGLRGPLLALSAPGATNLWSTGYYPAYRQSYYPPAAIDFSALSHLIHFSIGPRADGSLDTQGQGLTPALSADLVAKAHAAGTKALICVGGAGSQAAFQGATSSANLPAFVTNVLNFVSTYGYDGVDLDWEPLTDTDSTQFTNLVNGLRTALNGFSPRKLLTAATASLPALFATLQTQFDQINLMTYDLAGPWPGWVTWFNSPVYDGAYRFPSTGGLVPSIDGMVTNFLAHGVLGPKLGIGIPFYGDIWTHGAGTSTGGTLLPRQSWTTTPTVTPIAYFDVMASYFSSNLYHWDSAAQAAYLSITNPIATNDIFLSYDDQHACQAKVSYARNHRLGGVMVWEIGQGYRSTQPSGQRDPLLQAVKQALIATPDCTAIRPVNQDIQLSFATLPLGAYRVQWRSNLSSSWLTLTTNLSTSGGPLQVLDPGALTSQPARFYRVQTPP
jgi:chitinase